MQKIFRFVVLILLMNVVICKKGRGRLARFQRKQKKKWEQKLSMQEKQQDKKIEQLKLKLRDTGINYQLIDKGTVGYPLIFRPVFGANFESNSTLKNVYLR